MKFWEKYVEKIEIPESDVGEAQRFVVEGFMKEGELRYREYLISVLKRIDALMKEDADGVEPKLSIKSFIAFVEDEPIEVIK